MGSALRSSLLGLVTSLATFGPAWAEAGDSPAFEALRTLALAPARYAGPRRGYGQRFADRLARAVERCRPGETVLPADRVAAAIAAFETSLDEGQADAIAALRRGLRGAIEADNAPLLRQVCGAPALLLSGITGDHTAALAELWDLRQPACLGRWEVTAGNLGELLVQADRLGEAVASGWPREALLLPGDDGARVSGGLARIDRGRRQRLAPGATLWLLGSPRRSEDGEYTDRLATAVVIAVDPDTATIAIDAIAPEADPARAILAVEPAPRDPNAELIAALRPFVIVEFGARDERQPDSGHVP